MLHGTGYIPRGPETQIYSIEDSDLSLVATAEITLGGMLAGQTIDAERLPLKFCGISHCFRTEAGAHGRADPRPVSACTSSPRSRCSPSRCPSKATPCSTTSATWSAGLFDGLGIPYRVVDTATGDLGGPAYRKFDLEAWMPGRGEFGEVTSTSNCTDYQARRLGIRYRVRRAKRARISCTRSTARPSPSAAALIAILENYQQADGSILVPEVLRPLVGKERIG